MKGFLGKTGIKRSGRLHSKREGVRPADHAESMQKQREVSPKYDVSNIRNKNESGSTYRMGLKQSYLAPNEFGALARGNEFQKHKERGTFLR